METKNLIITIIATALFSAFCSATVIHWFKGKPSAKEPQISLLSRIEKLEAKLSKEQQARELLQDIVSQRSATQNRGQQGEDNYASESETDQASRPLANPVQNQTTNRPTREERNALRTERAQPEYQVQRLVNSGFSTEEATWVLNSESDVALRKLNQDFEKKRSALANNEKAVKSSREQLREQLGDDYYERYLKANGYPTSARIDEVMLGSPGANAGLKPGDKITNYDGRKVFNLRDVTAQTLTGTPGQSVLIEVIRNGEPIQLTIPRGPIGVSSRGRR